LVFLLGVLGKTAFGCGVLVDRVWWIGWVRWVLGCQFSSVGFFAGICGNLEIVLGSAAEEQTTTTTKARAID
jgi:hypothetical protein